MSFTLKNKGSTIASRLTPETRQRENNPGSASQFYLLTLNNFTFLNFESTCPPHLSLQRRQAGVCLSNRLKDLNKKAVEKVGGNWPNRPLYPVLSFETATKSCEITHLHAGWRFRIGLKDIIAVQLRAFLKGCYNIGKGYQHCIGEFPWLSHFFGSQRTWTTYLYNKNKIQFCGSCSFVFWEKIWVAQMHQDWPNEKMTTNLTAPPGHPEWIHLVAAAIHPQDWPHAVGPMWAPNKAGS